MRDEKKAIEEVYKNYDIRTDIFSIKQTSHATGLSRSMLLKLEEEGFLTPKHINQSSGYRYYDTFNIYKIMQYKRLRSMGFSQREIFDFYERGLTDAGNIIENLEKKRQLIDQTIRLMSLRSDKGNQYSFSYYDFSEQVCLVTETDISTPLEGLATAYNLSVEAVARGFVPMATEEMFTIREDGRDKSFGERYHVRIYQPIEPPKSKDKNYDDIEIAPACHTFSIMVYGLTNENMNEAKDLFFSEVERRELKPTGEPMRMQGIVAAYTAMHIEESDYVIRMSLPVEKNE